MSDTNPPSKPLVMTPGEISQFLADCRTLIAHSRTFYEVRDALSKAVWLIESNIRPVETTPRHQQPSYVLEQIMNNSTDPWARGVARTCLMSSSVEPIAKPNDAFRWICIHCTTVNGLDDPNCLGCRKPRYPLKAQQENGSEEQT